MARYGLMNLDLGFLDFELKIQVKVRGRCANRITRLGAIAESLGSGGRNGALQILWGKQCRFQ